MSSEDMLREAFDELPGSVEARRGTLRASAIAAYASVVAQCVAIVTIVVFVVQSAPEFALQTSPEYAVLNSQTLSQLWELRRAAEPAAQIWGFAGSLAWLFVIPVFQTFGDIFRRNYLSKYMVQLIACAAFLNFIEFATAVGSLGGAARLEASWDIFNSSNVNHTHDGGFGAFQALELQYMVTSYSRSWVFGMDYLLLGGGFTLLTNITYVDGSPLPTKCNTAAGGILTISCVLAFVIDLISTVDSGVGAISGFFTIVFEVTLVVWLVIAAIAMTKVAKEGGSRMSSSGAGSDERRATTSVGHAVELGAVKKVGDERQSDDMDGIELEGV